MNQPSPTQIKQPGTTNHRFFARTYERLSRSKSEQKFMNPLREEAVGQMRGVVLEVGAGTGLNFAFYEPERVERVEAVEPDTAMLEYAREQVKAARVPISLIQA